MWERPMLPARLAIGLFLLIGLALPLAASVHARWSGPRPHGEVILVSGPAVIAQEAVRRADAMPARDLDARVLDAGDDLEPDATTAREHVRKGAAVAAVVIDLRRSSDTLLLESWLPEEVADQVIADTSAVSASYGRQLRVERVSPQRPGHVQLPARLVVALIAVGLLLAAAVSAWRGPVAATTARGAARLVGTAAAGLLIGAVVAVVADTGDPLSTALACAGIVTVGAWLALAAESLLGLAGLGLATGLLLGPVAPLLLGADPAYLPTPWWQVQALSPQQAGLRLLQHDLMGVDAARARSWLLLLAWAAIAVLVLVTARRERPATHTP